jgi:uncharacterized membrane protein YGL010W
MKTATLNHLIDHYAQSHTNPRNELIHCICVPAILFAVLGVILAINFGLTLIAIALALVYYSRLGTGAALEMAVILVAMLAIWLVAVPSPYILITAVIIFVAAWIGQFVGHAIEGAKPSFLEDLQYLLIGPLFVVDALKRRLGIIRG